jgi:hypothetical protein
VVGPLFRRDAFFFSGESERMYSGTSSVPKISSGRKSRLKTKSRTEGNREQKERIDGTMRSQSRTEGKDRRKTYSRMVRFFGGALLSFMGCFPLSAMALGFSPLEKEEKM